MPEVRVLDDAAAHPDWDRLVAASAPGTFCHLSAWQRIFVDVLGHESRYLAAVDGDGRLAGALPLVRVRSRIFGDYLVSVPFLNYGGPVGDPAARALLVEHAVAEATDAGVDLLELRAREGSHPGLSSSARKITVLLDLPATPEELWSETFRPKLRSQIRRPQKAGMEARFGPDEAGAFYDVFSRNMRDLGTPVLPSRFFERIVADLPHETVVGAVYRGSEPVAAGFGFLWRGELEMTWASSLREHNRDAPNMLLYWAFMRLAIERGATCFNFGRCTPGGGTHRFKSQWGGVDAPLPWLHWSPRRTASQTPSPDRAGYRLAVRTWQRLPLAVTNRLGPMLARRIP